MSYDFTALAPHVRVSVGSTDLCGQNYPRIAADGKSALIVWTQMEGNQAQIAMRRSVAHQRLLQGPVPAHRTLQIDVPHILKDCHLQLQDMTGRIVYRKALPEIRANTDMSTEELAGGLYLLRLDASDGTHVQRFTVQHPWPTAGNILSRYRRKRSPAVHCH